MAESTVHIPAGSIFVIHGLHRDNDNVQHARKSSTQFWKVLSTIDLLTCKCGSKGIGSVSAVLSKDESRDGVRVIRDTLASDKIGTSRRGSATASAPGRNNGIPAKRGENTSATKSTKHDGVRLHFRRVESKLGRRKKQDVKAVAIRGHNWRENKLPCWNMQDKGKTRSYAVNLVLLPQ